MQPTGVPPYTTLIGASVALARNAAAVVPEIQTKINNYNRRQS